MTLGTAAPYPAFMPDDRVEAIADQIGLNTRRVDPDTGTKTRHLSIDHPLGVFLPFIHHSPGFVAEMLGTGKSPNETGRSAEDCIPLPVVTPNVSASAVGTWCTCRRKFMWEKRYNLIPKEWVYSEALTEGKWFHRFMQHAAQGVPVEQTVMEIGEQIKRRLAEVAAKSVVADRSASESLDLERTLQLVRAMSSAFLRRYPRDPHRRAFHLPDGTVAAEWLITIRQRGWPAHIKVIIDLVEEDTRDGSLWLTDYKTVGKSTKPMDRLRTMMWEIQPQLYRFAATTMLRTLGVDRPIVGFTHAVIQRPTIRQTQKEDYEGYLSRVDAWYADNTEYEKIVRSDIRFGQTPILTPDLGHWMTEMARASRAKIQLRHFPRDPSGRACFEYNRPCPYLRLCESPTDSWSQVIQESYKTKSMEDDDL